MRACSSYLHACASLCARLRACVCFGACVPVPTRARPFRPAVERVRLGSQAFYLTTAFSANIGAWNTARVSNMYQVCAAFRPARRARSVGARCGAALVATAPPMRARMCVRTHTYSLPRVSTCVPIAVRRNFGTHVCENIYIHVLSIYSHTCIYIHVSIYMHVYISIYMRASTFRRRWSSCCSARRRSTMRRRSTRTSARGTLCRSPRCPRYAPLSAGGAPPRRARSAGARRGAARVATAPPMRARMCACAPCVCLRL
jgi:hypothetical protein